ncbi:hypothetical protein OJAG_10120 [Oerskovia enterophila]|uniref:DUF4352 domain-containing protein n=1 Tax=Oerskovia enterophila TaxID=43678 RepID=A0A163SDP1_9CELL|nr:hypothetical protein OJAG_10120 [Oerskovia enterophila]
MSDLFAPPSSPLPESGAGTPAGPVPPAQQPPTTQLPPTSAPAPQQPPALVPPAAPAPPSSPAQPPASARTTTHPDVAPGIPPSGSSPYPGQVSPHSAAPGAPNPYGPPRPHTPSHGAAGFPADGTARTPGPSRVLVGVLAGVAGLLIGGVGATAVTLAVVAGNELFADAAAEPWSAGPAPDEEEAWDGHGDDQVAGEDGGTFDDPWALEGEVYTDEWSVLLEIPHEATAEILAHNDVNVSPADGMEYWIVPVDAMYLGPSSTVTAHGSIDLWFVDRDGNEYTEGCGDVPDSLVGTGLIGTDDSAQGNVCLEVPAGADGLWVLAVDDYMPVHLSTDVAITES